MSVANEIMKSKPMDFTDPNNKHDRVLIVGEKKFYVMSGVLSTWSEFFSVMFEGSFKEADKKEIEMKDIDPNALEQCLKIFYDSSLADFETDLLIPLIDLSFFLLAPKVLDSCRRFIEKSLETIDSKTVVKLLDKACVRDLEDLKMKIVDHLKSDTVMATFAIEEVVDCANDHELEDLKNWIGNYLAKSVFPSNCKNCLDYSEYKDLPTLKAAIINKVPTWDQDPVDYQRNGGKPLILEENIIDLMQSAFKHNVDSLKKILRKRIYYLLKPARKVYYHKCSSRNIHINTFMEKNLETIYALPKDIREYILTSTIRDN